MLRHQGPLRFVLTRSVLAPVGAVLRCGFRATLDGIHHRAC